jgi:hypothetical protein
MAQEIGMDITNTELGQEQHITRYFGLTQSTSATEKAHTTIDTSICWSFVGSNFAPFTSVQGSELAVLEIDGVQSSGMVAYLKVVPAAIGPEVPEKIQKRMVYKEERFIGRII